MKLALCSLFTLFALPTFAAEPNQLNCRFTQNDNIISTALIALENVDSEGLIPNTNLSMSVDYSPYYHELNLWVHDSNNETVGGIYIRGGSSRLPEKIEFLIHSEQGDNAIRVHCEPVVANPAN